MRYAITIFIYDFRLRYSFTIFAYGIHLRYSFTTFIYDIRLRYLFTIFAYDIRNKNYLIFHLKQQQLAYLDNAHTITNTAYDFRILCVCNRILN